MAKPRSHTKGWAGVWKRPLRIDQNSESELTVARMTDHNVRGRNGELLPTEEETQPKATHAWKGTWERPVGVDEDSVHPFTVARMTDHNVRASDSDESPADESPSVPERSERRRRWNLLRPQRRRRA